MVADKEEERLMKKKLEEMKKRFGLKEDKAKDFEIEIEVGDDDFQEKVIEMSKKVPVLVDFYAYWCPPCRILSPILEKIAKEYNGKFILAKVNVDDAQITAEEFGIMSIPTVVLFKNGEPIDYFVGALPETQIKDWLNRRL
ncbi:MAG: thioredoxin [Candidatus Aenigmarchaeota archaeon]|jgi:putative thioredoxin|nr:thioredoxin [Candidatus Aenigmarchaeota archaeon]